MTIHTDVSLGLLIIYAFFMVLLIRLDRKQEKILPKWYKACLPSLFFLPIMLRPNHRGVVDVSDPLLIGILLLAISFLSYGWWLAYMHQPQKL